MPEFRIVRYDEGNQKAFFYRKPPTPTPTKVMGGSGNAITPTPTPTPLPLNYFIGGFTTYNGIDSSGIVRLSSDGSLDSTFNVGTGITNGLASSGSLQSDGKVLVGGTFTVYNGTSVAQVIRINSDGSLDNTFNAASSGTVFHIRTQSDGKFFIGTNTNNVFRLNNDGSLDYLFTTGVANGIIYSTITQSDGKILCGGLFTTYNGSSINRIARLNSDGSLDNTFNIGTGFDNFVRSIKIQSDGKILCGGSFTTYNGSSINRIARLNSDGSLDNAFNIGTGFSSTVNAINIQSDGKILVGGIFTAYNGSSKNRIARLNSDGSLDDTFSVGTGFSSTVNAINIQSDGKILVGGTFTAYNGSSKNRIARLNSDGSLDDTFSIGTGFSSTVSTIL